MSTSYSFYKKCSSSGCALGLAVLVAVSSQIVLAQDVFAADGDGQSGVVAQKAEDTTTTDAPKPDVKPDGKNSAEVESEVDNRTLAEKLGLKTKSTEFLARFDQTIKQHQKDDEPRDPFSEMKMVSGDAVPTDESWWDESKDAQKVQENKDLYFNGQSPTESNEAYARLPMIKVTGMMQIGGRSAVTAIIQSKGSCVLYENDRLVLNATTGESMTKWLFVKQIHSNGMTLILDDGKEISGKFY